jgi:hypothetical protein
VWVARVDAVQHEEQQDGRGDGEEREQEGIPDGGGHAAPLDGTVPVAGFVHGDDATGGPVPARAAPGKASAKSAW